MADDILEGRELKDLCEAVVDCEHKTAPSQLQGIPSIRTTNISNGRLDIVSANRVSEETYVEWTARLEPRPGDLILAREAPVGEVGIVPPGQRVCLGQRTVLIRPNEALLHSRYLLYLLLTPEMRHAMSSKSDGCTVAHLNMSDIRKLKLKKLPSLSEQHAIAHILGTLDEKIELNRRMNETLESIARAIFKSWFVDFDPVRAKADGRQPVGMDTETAALFPDSFEDSPIRKVPKGWETCTLSDLSAYTLGGDWGKEQATDEYTTPAFCIRGADINNLQRADIGKMPSRFYKEQSLKKRTLMPGDIVVEISGGSPTQLTGRTVLITKHLIESLANQIVCTNFCRLLRPKSPWSLFVYLWFQWLYEEGVIYQYETGTTGIKNFAFTLFSEEFQTVKPKTLIIERFNNIVDQLLEKVALKGRESRVLADIRDTLLPKLISGEIRVKDAEKFVEEHAG